MNGNTDNPVGIPGSGNVPGPGGGGVIGNGGLGNEGNGSKGGDPGPGDVDVVGDLTIVQVILLALRVIK